MTVSSRLALAIKNGQKKQTTIKRFCLLKILLHITPFNILCKKTQQKISFVILIITKVYAHCSDGETTRCVSDGLGTELYILPLHYDTKSDSFQITFRKANFSNVSEFLCFHFKRVDSRNKIYSKSASLNTCLYLRIKVCWRD